MSNMDDTVLAMVRSPASGARLQPASADLIVRINGAIEQQLLQDQSGDVVDKPIESGLVDIENRCLFPVRQGIAILVSGQAIPLVGFSEI